MNNKIKYFLIYLCLAPLFELSISVFLALIGIIVFDNSNYYLFFASALLGGLWSYRVNYMYKIAREILGKKENNVKNYFENSILNADGYALRMRLSLGFFVLDTVLIFLLVL